MAVQSDTSREQYNGNGSTSTPYVIPFYFLNATHIKVDVDGVTLDGGYEVIGEGDQNGGSLTTTTAYTSEQVITIYRVVPLTQEFSYSEGGAIGTGTLERNQDTACMQSQQINEKVDRSLKFTVSGGPAAPIQPTPNTTVVLDENGNPAVKTAAEMIDHIGVQSSVDAAAASATSSANSATESANSATDSANTATNSATSATDSANSATASANSATASANSATASATSATNSATSAADSANSATASATSATDSANSATASASSATASAGSASDALATESRLLATEAAMGVLAGHHLSGQLCSYEGDDPEITGRYPQEGNVCEFDGVDDYILSSELIRPDLDVEFVFRVDSSTGASKAIFGGGVGSVRFYAQYNQYTGGTLHVVIGAYQSPGVLNSVTGVSENVWHTLRMKSNGDWYLNGIFQANVGDAVTTTPANTSQNKLNIGRRGDSTGTHSNISVASFKVIDDGDLSTQYNLNQASGTTAYDSSGNGNHGTLQNGAAFVVDNTLPPEADKLNLEGYTKATVLSVASSRIRFNTGVIPTFEASKIRIGWYQPYEITSATTSKTLCALNTTNGAVSIKLGASTGLATDETFTFNGNTSSRTYIKDVIPAGYHVVEIVSTGSNTWDIYLDDALMTKYTYSASTEKTINQVWVGPSLSGSDGVAGAVLQDFKIWDDSDVLQVDVDMENPSHTNLVGGESPSTDSGLVVMMPRDESEPSNDIFGNPLQYSGSVYPVIPRRYDSYAASFDGVNDVIESSITSWTTSQASVACWVKTTNTGNKAIATQWLSNSGWWVRMKAGKIEIYTSAGLRFASADTYNTGEWIHVAISYGLSTANNKLWINGVLEEEIGTSAGWSTATTPVLIGGLSSSGYNYNGEISNIIIDNQIWSDADALALYNGTYTGALIHHPLTEGSGDTAHDISGNGNHGTINNASTSSEGAGFWSGRIDGNSNAHNLNNGFTLYENGSNKLRVPYLYGSPISNPTIPSGYTFVSENPAIPGAVNGAETIEDVKGLSIDANTVPSTNHLGSAATAIGFSDTQTTLRAITPTDTVVRRDYTAESKDRLSTFPSDVSVDMKNLAITNTNA